MIHMEENPQNVTTTDLVVAIPTFNEAASIGRVVEIVGQGLKEYFRQAAVVINCDNHSLDGTRDAFFQADTSIPRIYLSTDRPGAARGPT